MGTRGQRRDPLAVTKAPRSCAKTQPTRAPRSEYRSAERRHPGLYFHGNAYHNAGAPELVSRSSKLARRLAEELHDEGDAGGGPASEGRRGRVLEICGSLSNLEVAAYVHGFLLETAERL